MLKRQYVPMILGAGLFALALAMSQGGFKTQQVFADDPSSTPTPTPTSTPASATPTPSSTQPSVSFRTTPSVSYKPGPEGFDEDTISFVWEVNTKSNPVHLKVYINETLVRDPVYIDSNRMKRDVVIEGYLESQSEIQSDYDIELELWSVGTTPAQVGYVSTTVSRPTPHQDLTNAWQLNVNSASVTFDENTQENVISVSVDGEKPIDVPAELLGMTTESSLQPSLFESFGTTSSEITFSGFSTISDYEFNQILNVRLYGDVDNNNQPVLLLDQPVLLPPIVDPSSSPSP